jgi:hypothetical protein
MKRRGFLKMIAAVAAAPVAAAEVAARPVQRVGHFLRPGVYTQEIDFSGIAGGIWQEGYIDVPWLSIYSTPPQVIRGMIAHEVASVQPMASRPFEELARSLKKHEHAIRRLRGSYSTADRSKNLRKGTAESRPEPQHPEAIAAIRCFAPPCSRVPARG